MRLKKQSLLSLLFIASFCMQGCATAVVAGAAATGGYIAHKEGYEVQSPVKKKKEKTNEKED